MGRERSTGRARAVREGELLERWRRAADLLHEAPAKFKVMRRRVVQRLLQPLAQLSLTASLLQQVIPHAHPRPMHHT